MKINETFLSIQGEGLQSGLPSFFIRTKGCNLRCSYCDTQHAFYEGEEMHIEDLLIKVQNQPYKRVCLTGGEPLLQLDSKPLINMLVGQGYAVDIETNGSIDLKGLPRSKKIIYSMDIKCPSSGCAEEMVWSNVYYLSKKDQIKFVIGSNEDYEYSKKIMERFNLLKNTNVILTPVGGIDAEQIVENTLKDGLNVRIGLQIHKIIWGEKRGV